MRLMASIPAQVLAINGGSSSIKFAVYRAGTLPQPSLSGKLDRIGRDGTTLSWRGTDGASREGHTEVADDKPATGLLIDWLEAREEFASVSALGHRLVHGMARTAPEIRNWRWALGTTAQGARERSRSRLTRAPCTGWAP